MMKKMMTIHKKTIKFLLALELSILLGAFFSFAFFINLQVAFLSSFFVIAGSAYAYQRMVKMQAELESGDAKREFLDEVEDPYELYDETPINDASAEELDLRAIVKEEKKKIKIFNFQDIKKGSRASVSLFRLVPYLFLIVGFIALQNNGVLDIAIYLPSLLLGIIAGYVVSKEFSL